MKNTVLIMLLCIATSVSAQKGVNWLSMNDALAIQAQDPKPIFIDMYTSWCGPCKMLDRNTFSNEDVINYMNEHYYAVKFNAEGDEKVTYMGNNFGNPRYDPAKAKRRNTQHDFAKHMSIRAYPTVVFLNEKGELLTAVKSYRTPQQLELYLKLFATGDYKNLKSNEEFAAYTDNFVPQFKEKKGK
ncbi:thioredoxin [Patiriisocius marinistellae]|uniref:Thioredoxin n=1 Tax=Patiriisocius marinistellae TaxID=2494560 RepID=A0A5J4FW17_9FLAO|nr:thioredoxin family protein [Patiriisocius marinistellae]GEQ85362.1 thioredoxin [Patiriisocius marinistellae]